MTERDTFISEVFWTSDSRFAWQKVGKYYRLYDRETEYGFMKEFTGLIAMQKFMNELRRTEWEGKKAENLTQTST